MNPDRTDDELARLDMGVLLRYGLTAPPGPRRTALFGDDAAGAAVLLDRLGTQPRSVAFLADTVRAAWPRLRRRAPRAAAAPGGGGWRGPGGADRHDSPGVPRNTGFVNAASAPGTGPAAVSCRTSART
ncbi:hypothetical protein ACQ4WX_22430 [Streptomyces lasalocidi]